MKKSFLFRVITSLLCVITILGAFELPAFANSAQSWFQGTDSTGAIMTDTESPIIVERERLIFDIGEFPQTYYFDDKLEDLMAYSSKVTAEYTFCNPSKYTVTARLLFPFGSKPHYLPDDHDDTQKYDITVNGKTVEKKIRHTLKDPYEQFNIYQDLFLLTDGFADDDFYRLDLPVTKYTFELNGVDKEQDLRIGLDVPQGGLDSYRIYMPAQSGMSHTKDGDMRIFQWMTRYDSQFELYIFGNTTIASMPKFSVYLGGTDDRNEIDADIQLVNAEAMTFKDFALSKRNSESEISESDWYNAILADLKQGLSSPDYPVVGHLRSEYGRFEYDFMRWYEYEITLQPGERIINTVVAPMYPAIDLGYEPDIYEYTYLLSPAKTWKSFGELEIIINTPYYVTDSSLGEFENTDDGYRLLLDGLPVGELNFTLSTGPDPRQEINSYTVGFIIGVILIIIIIVVIALTVIGAAGSLITNVAITLISCSVIAILIVSGVIVLIIANKKRQ